MALLPSLRALVSRPRFWVFLLLWPVFVLLFIMAPLGLWHCAGPATGALLTAIILSAVASLAALALIARRLHRGLRAIRSKLFEGDYEMALDIARHNPGLGAALGFDAALTRMLDFDSRRAGKVAAATRLLSSLLNEAPTPFFIANLEDDLISFSRAARALFNVNVDRFSLLSVLLLPANREFADLYHSVTRGERTRADAMLTVHLPVRKAARTLSVQMLAVQDDDGAVLYVLGLLRPHTEDAAPPARTDLRPTAFFQDDPRPPQAPKGNDDAPSQG